MPTPHPDWSAARSAMMLDPTVANLNTGSFGPLPKVVFERVTELRRRLAEEPMDFLVRQLPPLLWEARTRLAQFLGADARRLIFTANVSTAINMVASGLTLAEPGEILLSDLEYGAMHWCWERAAQRQGLRVRVFRVPGTKPSSNSSGAARDGTPHPNPSPPRGEGLSGPHPNREGGQGVENTLPLKDAIISAMRAALSERTRLVFISHVVSPTGLVMPVKEMCREARRFGAITVVDGAHAPAMVPLDLEDIGADFYTGNCHKWLLAPTGAGFLYLGRGQEDRLQPLQVSWGWRPDRSRMCEADEFGSTPRLRFYEFEGTRDVCPWLTVPAALNFRAGLGWEAIRVRNRELSTYVRQRFARIPGLVPATPEDPELSGFMTAFWLPPAAEATHWRRRLWEEFRVEAPIVERPRGLLVRVSTHFYNTVEEIERLAAAVETM